MTGGFIRRRTTLTVARRLFLSLLPAILAIVLAVGLAYYGEYGRAAPNVVVVAASVLAIVSFVMTWVNIRYLSDRITRLTLLSEPESHAVVSADADEFDRIERAVDNLGNALSASHEELAYATAEANARLRDEATMLSGVARDTSVQIDALRLPLHILLDTRFGELNENQEELLRDARAAADAVSSALHRLSLLADADRGSLQVLRESVQLNDVVRSILPLARAAAARRNARVDVELEPGLPRVDADRARLAEAVALLSTGAAATAAANGSMVVRTRRDAGGVSLILVPAPEFERSVIARRLVEVQDGTVECAEESLIVRFSDGRG